MSKLLSLSVHQFPHLEKSQDNIDIYFMSFRGLAEIMDMKPKHDAWHIVIAPNYWLLLVVLVLLRAKKKRIESI